MTTLQTFLQAIWNSVLSLGLVKTAIFVIIIALLARAQPLLGLIGTIIFIAFLAHFI